MLVWANVGGVTGGTALGLLSARFGLKPMTVGLMLASTLMLAVFGNGWSDLPHLCLICALTGFCTNGAVVGMFAILARAYPGGDARHRHRICRGHRAWRGGAGADHRRFSVPRRPRTCSSSR